MATSKWKFVVWERLNKAGKWCPYSAEVSQFLELNYKKESIVVPLGDVDKQLKIYSVNLKDMLQTSEKTGTNSNVRRCLCDSVNNICNGCIWQWNDSHNSWHSYEIEVNNYIEDAYQKGIKNITLNKVFRNYHYEVDFVKMSQINKQTKKRRNIRRQQQTSPYPVIDVSSSNVDLPTTGNANFVSYPYLLAEIPGSSALEDQVNSYLQNAQQSCSETLKDNHQTLHNSVTVGNNQNGCLNAQTNVMTAIVNGQPWYYSRPPHTPQSRLKPVPGLEPLPKFVKKKQKKLKISSVKKGTEEPSTINQFIVEMNLNSSENNDECIICCENLTHGSSYDGDATAVKLKLCPHIFHKSCLLQMYKSGSKDNFLQCPICKTIHGEKSGTQPQGSMIYHVLPYSLPGHSECDTIQIIYDIPSGIQGSEHPNPGKRYTSRGFPRHCYLPDNEVGRKILRLLIKAWKRRLIFTIGRSSTTGEENTVTWNEIHHKTEFGCNRLGHGFPDPNYFTNVLAELEAHGVKDDDVFAWFPV